MDNYFEAFYANSPVPYLIISTQYSADQKKSFVINEANQAFYNMIAMTAEDTVGRELTKIFPAECKQGKDSMMSASSDTSDTQQVVIIDILIRKIKRWMRVRFFSLGKNYIGSSFVDIEKEYRQGEAINNFLRINLDMLCVCNVEGIILKVNKKFEQVLGYKPEAIEGQTLFAFIHEEDIEQMLRIQQKVLSSKSDVVFSNRFRCMDGSYKHLEWHSELMESGEVYGSARDITEKIQLEKQLRKLAVRDELTGLYNRHYLDTVIDSETQQADRYNRHYTMALLDLDFFKRVNDTWGHPVGDEILKQTANVILGLIRSSDILIRFGGEEFLLLMPQTGLNGAVEVAEKIREGIEAIDHSVVGRRTISIGVAERMRYESFNNWYRRADYALYQAKDNGRNKVVAVDDITGAPEVTICLTWKSQWESGNQDIDKQHRILMEEANTLITMSLEKYSKEEMQEQINKIVDDCESHFAFEEGILDIRKYPKASEHGEIHKKLLVKAIKLKKAYERGHVRPTAFFSFLVDDVILGHLLEEDVKFFPYIEER